MAASLSSGSSVHWWFVMSPPASIFFDSLHRKPLSAHINANPSANMKAGGTSAARLAPNGFAAFLYCLPLSTRSSAGGCSHFQELSRAIAHRDLECAFGFVLGA